MTKIDEYCNVRQLCNALNMSRSAIYGLAKRGLFPAGIRIGRSHRWQVQEVRNWLEGKQKGEVQA